MHFRFTVIGAGVVGLAIARTLLMRHNAENAVLVVEAGESFGGGISSRNSEVIHAGIYYRTGSLKHRLCMEGRRLLYDYCEKYKVRHRKCGKLIVAATGEELEALADIEAQARANGVEHLERLSASQVADLEPDVRAEAALYSAETGILDSHGFMAAMAAEIEAQNGTLVFRAPVIGVEQGHPGFCLRLGDGTAFSSDYVINAAGLGALAVSRMIGLAPVTVYPCKGSYFHYKRAHRLQHLVYPVPEKKLTGLGVHATLDLAGRLKFGPDTEYVDSMDDFDVFAGKRDLFGQAARRIIPGLALENLVPDLAGIRPKLQGPQDKEVKDFYICEESSRPGWINLLGIESPGLTSALAIGRYVVEEMIRWD